MASKAGKTAAKAAAPVVAAKAAPVATKREPSKLFMRTIDPKTLVWPKQASHLFVDASPAIFDLPLTRRLRNTLKLRAKADELFMYFAYDFHHRVNSLKTTSLVFDRIHELEEEEGAFGVDYRIISAQPHFHDANHLLLRQAQLDPVLTKSSVFVTDHFSLTQQLKKAGAALVLSPLQWLDYVIASHGKSGSVDAMVFMKEFAHQNAKQLDIAPLPGTATEEQFKADPYVAYRDIFPGWQHDAMPPGFTSPDWYNTGRHKYQYRESDKPKLPQEVQARLDQVAKRKAVLEGKKIAVLSALQQAESSSSSSPASIAASSSSSSSSASHEFSLYTSVIQSSQDAWVRSVLSADQIQSWLQAGHIDAKSLSVSSSAPANVREVLQASLDQFFIMRLAQKAPQLYESVSVNLKETQSPLQFFSIDSEDVNPTGPTPNAHEMASQALSSSSSSSQATTL